MGVGLYRKVNSLSLCRRFSFLTFLSCAFLKCASDPLHSKLWIQIWQLCSRLASSQSTSRVACHIMRILITRDLVPYPDISKDIDSMLESIEVLGPASLTDSSMALWCLILERRQSVVHSTRLNPGERLFPWFASKWKPGMFSIVLNGRLLNL